MNLLNLLKENKLVLITFYVLIREMAEKNGVNLEGSLSEIAARADVNRTWIYEKKKQIEQVLQNVYLPGAGRPKIQREESDLLQREKEWQLKETVLRYRLDNPGALVKHPHQVACSDPFKRLILNLADTLEGSTERFCELVEVPYSTFKSWQYQDQKGELDSRPDPIRPKPVWPGHANETCVMIAEEYERWQGSLRQFLRYLARKWDLAPAAICRVLRIAKLLNVRSQMSPRYRGSTEKLSPGSILVTDGKPLKIELAAGQNKKNLNWQAMVDQATVCHTGGNVTENECASGVQAAFEQSCHLLGRDPLALLHDRKPIHEDAELRAAIEPTTEMIPATPARPENKADVEGEFGKFEQTVGTIRFDDTSMESMVLSAAGEVVRAYTAGINHAGRFEYQGKSRLQVLREACPDPEKDRKFIARLKAGHTQQKRFARPLKTRPIALAMLKQGFRDLNLEESDKNQKLITWLSSRFIPEAIRQALAILMIKKEKGTLDEKFAVRYLVKVIINRQHELDLEREEELLLHYAECEKAAWLEELESEYNQLLDQAREENHSDLEIVRLLAEKAIQGGIFLQRSFWKNRLKQWLDERRKLFQPVCNHVRRLFEGNKDDRFQLISQLVNWEMKLAA